MEVENIWELLKADAHKEGHVKAEPLMEAQISKRGAALQHGPKQSQTTVTRRG